MPRRHPAEKRPTSFPMAPSSDVWAAMTPQERQATADSLPAKMTKWERSPRKAGPNYTPLQFEFFLEPQPNMDEEIGKLAEKMANIDLRVRELTRLHTEEARLRAEESTARLTAEARVAELLAELEKLRAEQR